MKKPRLDTPPHLEPLRYDYQLLHDSYKQVRRRNGQNLLEGIAYLLAILLILMLLGRAIYGAVTSSNSLNPWHKIAEVFKL